MSNLQCPQCGASLTMAEQLAQCPHCGSALLLEHQAVTAQPSLITPGKAFQWRNQHYIPQGYVQFEHAEGVLREWQVVRETDGAVFWLGEHDEDCFLLEAVECTGTASLHWSSLQPNRQLTLRDETWLVTEKYQLRCLGSAGEIAQVCHPGDVCQQLYLARSDASILLLIWVNDGLRCRRGCWLDPFEIGGQP